MNPIKIAIGIPSRAKEYIPSEWFGMLNDLIAETGNDITVIHEISKYRDVSQQRNVIFEKVLEGDYDYFFFLDDDVFVPANAILKLIEANKPLISGVYWNKSDIDFNSLSEYKWDNREIFKLTDDQKNQCGFGCCLMDRTVLDKARNLDKPIVPKFYKPTPDCTPAGEDAAFFHKIGEDLYIHGDVLCDHYEHTKRKFYPSDFTCNQLVRQKRFYKDLPYQKSNKRRGVYFMTDDNWYEYAVAFLNSFRQAMPEIELCMIPATENIQRVSTLKDQYNFTILDADLKKYDKLSLEFGELDPTYRKFAVWEGIFDEFIYLPTDCVIFRDLSFLLEGLSQYDFIADCNFAQCWDKDILKTRLITEKHYRLQPEFCYFTSKTGLITWQMIQDNLETLKKLQEYIMCKRKPMIKQSSFIYLINFSNCFILRTPISYCAECNIAELEEGKLVGTNREIMLLHWRALAWDDLEFKKDNKYKSIWEHYRWQNCDSRLLELCS